MFFVDDATNSPEWATVNTGLFGGRRASFVPIEGVRQEGNELLIPWDRAQVKGAPQVDDDDDGHLTPEEEVQLYRYYAKEQRLATDADEKELRRGHRRCSQGWEATDAKPGPSTAREIGDEANLKNPRAAGQAPRA